MMIRALVSVGLALNYSTHLLRNPGIYPPLLTSCSLSAFSRVTRFLPGCCTSVTHGRSAMCNLLAGERNWGVAAIGG
jgi:hypothetical protein